MAELGYDGKVVVITGAGGGLGRQHALLMAQRGALLVINDLGGGIDGTGGDLGPAARTAKEINDLGGVAVADGNSVATAEGGEAVVTTGALPDGTTFNGARGPLQYAVTRAAVDLRPDGRLAIDADITARALGADIGAELLGSGVLSYRDGEFFLGDVAVEEVMLATGPPRQGGDDAHGEGVLGKGGRGIVDHCPIRIDLNLALRVDDHRARGDAHACPRPGGAAAAGHAERVPPGADRGQRAGDHRGRWPRLQPGAALALGPDRPGVPAPPRPAAGRLGGRQAYPTPSAAATSSIVATRPCRAAVLRSVARCRSSSSAAQASATSTTSWPPMPENWRAPTRSAAT